MKKTFTLIFFVLLQLNFFSQVVSTNINDLSKKKISVKDSPKDDISKDKLVSYEFTLNLISVAESTRNTIDNNDCKQTWGKVTVTFRELDANGEIDLHIPPIKTDFNETILFDFFAGNDAYYRSNSYYGDSRELDDNNYIKRISVRVSENLVKNRRIVAVVECDMKTAHKDNDFASFDRLRMARKESAYFYLEDIARKEEVMMVKTDGYYSVFKTKGGSGVSTSFSGNPDDTHRIWLGFTIKKK